MPPIYGPPNVYSKLLVAQAALPAGNTPILGPPSGYVWIALYVAVYVPFFTGPNAFRVYEVTSGIPFAGDVTPATLLANMHTFSMYQVIEGGQEIGFYSDNSGCDLCISGYQLTLP